MSNATRPPGADAPTARDGASPDDATQTSGASPPASAAEEGSQATMPGSPPPGTTPQVEAGPVDRAPPSLAEADRYLVLKELARGGMGRVLVAVDQRVGREVAIKEMLRATDPVHVARFWRESLMTARLQHPGIVPVYEVGEKATGEPFLTMRRVEGRPLEELVKAATTPEQRLRLLPHVLAAADAVAYAHERNVIHRDLKPANIMVGSFGETLVIDWGLAKDLGPTPAKAQAEALPGDSLSDSSAETKDSDEERTGLTLQGAVIGTPAYMSPEQASGHPADPRSDVYSLGVILFQLLTGVLPFQGKSSKELLLRVLTAEPQPLGQLAPWVAPDLASLVKRAMARKPDGRFASAQAFAAELRGFLAGQLVGSHQYTLRERLTRFARKNAAALLVASAAVVVLLAIGAVALNRVLTERRAAQTASDFAQERQQQLTLEKARALLETDAVAALETIGTLSQTRGGWGDARLLAQDLVERGLPAWRLQLPSEDSVRRSRGGLWLDGGEQQTWVVDQKTGAFSQVNGIKGTLGAVSPDGTVLVTEDDGRLRFWSNAGAPLGAGSKQRRPGTGSRYAALRALSGGTPAALALVQGEGLVRVEAGGDDKALLPEATDYFLFGDGVLFDASEDGTRIVFLAQDPAISGLDAVAKARVRERFPVAEKDLPQSHPVVSWLWSEATGRRRLPGYARSHASLSPDGSLLGWVDGGRLFVETFNGAPVVQSRSTSATGEWAFSSDSRSLALLDAGGVELIQIGNRKGRGETQAEHESVHHSLALPEVRSVEFTESSDRVVVAGGRGAWVIDLASGQIERTVHRPGLTDAWLHGDLLLALEAGTSPLLRAWRPPTPPRKEPTSEPVSVERIIGNRILARPLQFDSQSLLWDAGQRNGRPVAQEFAVSPTGRFLAEQSRAVVHVEPLDAPGPARDQLIGAERVLLAVSDDGGLALVEPGKSASQLFWLAPGSAEELTIAPTAGAIGWERAMWCGRDRLIARSTRDVWATFDVRTGAAGSIEVPKEYAGLAPQCSPDGPLFAIDGDDLPPLLGDLDHPERLDHLHPDSTVAGVSFLGPRGAAAIVGSATLWLRPSAQASFDARPLPGGSEVSMLAFSPDGGRVCLVDSAGRLFTTGVGAQSLRRLSVDNGHRWLGRAPYGCGFVTVEQRLQVVAGHPGGGLYFFDDSLPAAPEALLAHLRALTEHRAVPEDSSPDAQVLRALRDGIHLVVLGRAVRGGKVLEKAATLPASPPTLARLYKNLAVTKARLGDFDEGIKYLRLYLPFAQEDRSQVLAAIARFEKLRPKPPLPAGAASATSTPPK